MLFCDLRVPEWSIVRPSTKDLKFDCIHDPDSAEKCQVFGENTETELPEFIETAYEFNTFKNHWNFDEPTKIQRFDFIGYTHFGFHLTIFFRHSPKHV